MARKRRGRRPRGAGSIFQAPGCDTWTIKFSAHGRTVREATGFSGEDGRARAQQLLTQRIHEIDTGRFIAPEVQRIRVCDLADDFLRDYRIQKRKSVGHAERRWRLHLEPFFGQLRVGAVTITLINKYVETRQKAKAENGTINRELAALKRMFRLGHKASKLTFLPAFPSRLKETNVRQGFVDDAQYSALVAAAGELWLRAYLEVAFTYGWRKHELLNLRVRQVDLKARTLRLDVGSTKNDEGREVALSANAHTLLTECVRGKGPDDHVFTRHGRPVLDFRKAWAKLCIAAGVGAMVCRACKKTVTGDECECGSRKLKYAGLIVHDLRRSAARNLRNADVPEGVIMKIGGWKTRNVFDRYSIMAQSDLADAIKKLEQNRVDKSRLSHDLVISENAETRNESTSSKQIN